MFGALRNAIFGSREAAVVSALNMGEIAPLLKYLRSGGNPNAESVLPGGRKGDDVKPRSLAIWACIYNCKDGLTALLDAGASPHAFDWNDKTQIIHKVANWDDPALMKRLLELGADPEGGGQASSSPVYIAALRNSTEVVKLLVEAGADISKPNWGGVTPQELLLEHQEETEKESLAREIRRESPSESRSFESVIDKIEGFSR